MMQVDLMSQARDVARRRESLKATLTSELEGLREKRRLFETECEAKEQEITKALRLLGEGEAPEPHPLLELAPPMASVAAAPASPPDLAPEPPVAKSATPGPHVPPPSIASQILAVLERGPMTSREASLAIGPHASGSTVAATLSLLSAKGTVIHDPQTHKYALPSHAPKPAPDREPIITPPPAGPSLVVGTVPTAPVATATIDEICEQAGVESPPKDHPIRDTRPTPVFPVPVSKSEAKRVAVQATARAELPPPQDAKPPVVHFPGDKEPTELRPRAEVAPKPSPAEKAASAMTPQALVLAFLEEHGPATLSEIVDHLVKCGRQRATAPAVVHGMFPDTIRKMQDRYYVPRKPGAAEKQADDDEADDDEESEDRDDAPAPREPRPTREAFVTKPPPALPKSSWVTAPRAAEPEKKKGAAKAK